MRLTAIAILLLFAAPVAQAQPATKTLMVAGDDGYGTTDCLASGAHCGQLIADAMCVREGFRHASRITPTGAGDVTGALSASAGTAPAFVVVCGY